ncbi:MAG: hypothetical protein JXM71_08535, partial [Spirochaetales bacterium]|nr:hypothetical protein [Spirochaetales bacterium]
MPVDDFPEDIREKYELHEWKHATAILKHDFPNEWKDILAILRAFKLKRSWIMTPGGRKSQIADFIDDFMTQRGWQEKHFMTSVNVDGSRYDSPTHKIDCYRNRIALELEW